MICPYDNDNVKSEEVILVSGRRADREPREMLIRARVEEGPAEGRADRGTRGWPIGARRDGRKRPERGPIRSRGAEGRGAEGREPIFYIELQKLDYSFDNNLH